MSIDVYSKFPSGVKNLTVSQVRQMSTLLRRLGRKLPKSGYCQRLEDRRSLCHDHRGYYIVGMTEWKLPR